MKQGKVKWYNKEKGYGFIEAEGEKDYFVNKYNIEDNDYLEEGDKVEFEEKIIKEKGREAIKVKKVTNDYNEIVNKEYTLRDVDKAEDFIEDLIYTYQLVRNKKLSKETRERLLQDTLDYSLEAYFVDIEYWLEEYENEE